MSYRVVVLPKALAEIEQAYRWFSEEASLSYAGKWLDGITQAIESLDTFPERCAITPESDAFQEEVRQLLYGKRRSVYRILFTVQEDTVFVLRVRHAAQQRLTAEDLEEEEEV
jgi:plasmid stabilization system protein ParE